jgi:hypothetical protein
MKKIKPKYLNTYYTIIATIFLTLTLSTDIDVAKIFLILFLPAIIVWGIFDNRYKKCWR